MARDPFTSVGVRPGTAERFRELRDEELEQSSDEALTALMDVWERKTSEP